MDLHAIEPIAGATPLDEALADHDRRWLVVDSENAWLRPDRAPGLAELQLALRFGYLVIRAPGMLRLDIPLDVIEDDSSVERTVKVDGRDVRAVDEGDLAAAWFAQWLGQPCRLMKVHPEAPAVAWPDRAAAA